MRSIRPWIVLISSIVFSSQSSAALSDDVPNQIKLQVRETAGIRRFGYPVAAELRLEPSGTAFTRFQLLHLGKPVTAQFRPMGRQGDRIESIALDFDSNFMPHESRDYTVEFGEKVMPSQEPDRGMRVEENSDSFVVSNGPNLVWTVPKNLSGFIRSVKTAKWDYLRPESAGLSVLYRNGRSGPLADAEQWRIHGMITKQGPIDCSLRFEGAGVIEENRGVKWTIELGFPRSKSWVKVRWHLDDPNDRVSGLVSDLNLRTGDGPTLVDFGVDDLVYAAVPDGQVVVLESGSFESGASKAGGRKQPGWTTYRGRPDSLEPYVIGGSFEARRWGWAHVMDRQRCAAVALDGFADRTRDRIEIAADGRMTLSRSIAGAQGDKQTSGKMKLDYWIHFVPFPPHVGAVTSPQSMQSPLEVQVHSPTKQTQESQKSRP